MQERTMDEMITHFNDTISTMNISRKDKMTLLGMITAIGYKYQQAAEAIEELLKAAKAMHTWIFLNTGDEQKAYDECGLSDEMNAALGYGGQFVAGPPEEE